MSSLGSNEHSSGGHINQSGARGSQEGVKLHGTKIVNMLQLSCNACQILPWVIRNKKSNYMKLIQCFVLEIEVKLTKGHWPFFRGGQIFKSVWFQRKWAQIDWIIKMIQKRYSFAYLGSQSVWIKGSELNGHIWSMAIELWPPCDQNGDI